MADDDLPVGHRAAAEFILAGQPADGVDNVGDLGSLTSAVLAQAQLIAAVAHALLAEPEPTVVDIDFDQVIGKRGGDTEFAAAFTSSAAEQGVAPAPETGERPAWQTEDTAHIAAAIRRTLGRLNGLAEVDAVIEPDALAVLGAAAEVLDRLAARGDETTEAPDRPPRTATAEDVAYWAFLTLNSPTLYGAQGLRPPTSEDRAVSASLDHEPHAVRVRLESGAVALLTVTIEDPHR